MTRNGFVNVMRQACMDAEARLEDAGIAVRIDRKVKSKKKEKYVLKRTDDGFGFCLEGANSPQPSIFVNLGVRATDGSVDDITAYMQPRRRWTAPARDREKFSEVLSAVCTPVWRKALPALHSKASDFRARQKPIGIGASISHGADKKGGGSIGFFARRDPASSVNAEWFANHPSPLLLAVSAGHALLRVSDSQLRGQLRHPARAYEKGDNSAAIGEIIGGIRAARGQKVVVDAAIATLHDESLFNLTSLGSDRSLNGVLTEEDFADFHNMEVIKRGAGSGERFGMIKRFVGTQSFYIDKDYNIGHIQDCWMVESIEEEEDFTREGDSGALVFTKIKCQAAGIILGGLRAEDTMDKKGIGFFTPVHLIEEKLGIRLELAHAR